MNQEQYIKLLKKRLRRLPKADFNKAVEYFEEYFAEAGPENVQQAIADLGMPEEAAEQIIRDIAVKNTEKPVKSVKKGLSAVWVGVLAVFAVPIGLPLVLGLVFVVFFLLLAVLLVLLSLLLAGVYLVCMGPIAIAAGVSMLTEGMANSIMCFGYALLGIGLGLLLVYGMCQAFRGFLNWVIRLFGRIVKRGEKKDE